MSSPVGDLTLIGDGDHLAGLYLPAQRAPEVPHAILTEVLRETARQLGEYFAGSRRVFDLQLAPRGTAFQRRVWDALGTIPYGETWTYGALAVAIQRGPAASRAVGTANGKNPISIIVPCHRVIGASGELTGYAGGLPAKRWLLGHEAATVQRWHRGLSSA